MRRRRMVFALTLLATSVPAQVTVVAPGVPPGGGSARSSDANYGPPRVVELDAILFDDGNQKRHVITEGEVGIYRRGEYWTLRNGGPSVLLIPAHGFDRSELDQVIGERRIEVRGIVRRIREKEYVGPTRVDLDLVEDPTLPPMPPPLDREGGPRISITVFAIQDRTNPETRRPKEVEGGISWQIIQEPAAYLGKKTRIYGQFRGRNLFGDLPPGSARGKDDWVLKDGDTAIWIVGKTPKGEGWKLDLEYKGDSKNWLEVEGKPEVQNGILYLKASRVLMSKAPGKEKPEPPSR